MTKSMVSGCIAAGLILLMANASLAQTAVSNDKGLRKRISGRKSRASRLLTLISDPAWRLMSVVRPLSSSLNMAATAIWAMGWMPAAKGQSTTPASANSHT